MNSTYLSWLIVTLDTNRTEPSLMLLLTPALQLKCYDKSECQPFSVSQLPSFIRLVDYLVISTLHKLVVNAVAKLLTVLQEQVCQTPSHALIQSWSQQPEGTTDPAEEEMCKKVGHCFSVITSGATAITISTKCEFSSRQTCVQFWSVCVFISLSSQKLPMLNLCSSLSWCWTQMHWPTNPLRRTFRLVFQLVLNCFTLSYLFTLLIPVYVILLVNSYRRPLQRSLGGWRKQ